MAGLGIDLNQACKYYNSVIFNKIALENANKTKPNEINQSINQNL